MPNLCKHTRDIQPHSIATMVALLRALLPAWALSSLGAAPPSEQHGAITLARAAVAPAYDAAMEYAEPIEAYEPAPAYDEKSFAPSRASEDWKPSTVTEWVTQTVDEVTGTVSVEPAEAPISIPFSDTPSGSSCPPPSSRYVATSLVWTWLWIFFGVLVPFAGFAFHQWLDAFRGRHEQALLDKDALIANL